MRDIFVFIDGLNLYCNNGNRTRILKKDLKEARKKGMKNSDIKIAAYNALSNDEKLDSFFIDKTQH